MAMVVRLLSLAGLWMVLTEGDASSVALGGLAVVLAAATHVHLYPRHRAGRPSIPQAIKVLGRIPLDSVRAGMDVAIRAFRPSLPIRPGLVRVPIPVVGPSAQVGTAYLMTILPGSVCVALETACLRLHLIDACRPVDEHVAQVARQLADVTGGNRHA